MVTSEAPQFWFEKPGLKSWALWPFSAIYNLKASSRMLSEPTGQVDAPVVCVGNFIAGGGGKTPTAIALAIAAKERGLKPGFLTRGYGGRVKTPTLVNLKQHNAVDVGDEPLLLAAIAKTAVSGDRVAASKLLLEAGCNFIIMDDGFQNPKLYKDYTIVAVDSRRGIGNGYTMPAGPLRVQLKDQMLRADAVLIIGKGEGADNVIRYTARSGKPVYWAEMILEKPEQWRGKRVLPYAGIADPEKFFIALENAGADFIQTCSFGDHHFYSDDEVTELQQSAASLKVQLVTTAKDHVRLKGAGEAQEELARKTKVVKAELKFNKSSAFVPDMIIDKAIESFESRTVKSVQSA